MGHGIGRRFIVAAKMFRSESRSTFALFLVVAIVASGCLGNRTTRDIGGAEYEVPRPSGSGSAEWAIAMNVPANRIFSTNITVHPAGTGDRVDVSSELRVDTVPGEVVGAAVSVTVANASTSPQTMAGGTAFISAGGLGIGAWQEGRQVVRAGPMNNPADPAGIYPRSSTWFNVNGNDTHWINVMIITWGPKEASSVARVSLSLQSSKAIIYRGQDTWTNETESLLGMIATRNAKTNSSSKFVVQGGATTYTDVKDWRPTFSTKSAAYVSAMAVSNRPPYLGLKPGFLNADFQNETASWRVALGKGSNHEVWGFQQNWSTPQHWHIRLDAEGQGEFTLFWADVDFPVQHPMNDLH